MIEIISGSSEFERNPLREIERKYIPLFPDCLLALRERSIPIEQFYLSHPSEDFSLRFRETFKDGVPIHTATLKDRGTITDQGLDRLEVEVPVTVDLYNFYKAQDVPVLHKLRATANNNVSVDFYDNEYVQVESEHPVAWTHFTDSYGSHFVDVTGEKMADNEWLAHLAYRRNHKGSEALLPKPDLNTESMVMDIARAYAQSANVTVQLLGRSGSGKSTIASEIQRKLVDQDINSIVLSTDDYHRGAAWLREYNNGIEWTAWDDPIVYDTSAMAVDLHRIYEGKNILGRSIDFTVCEPIQTGEVKPAPVVIVEGIYAGHPDFDEFSRLRYDIPTPLATCIGRRLLRDIKERPQFSNLQTSLQYMLEEAEPMWRKQRKV